MLNTNDKNTTQDKSNKATTSGAVDKKQIKVGMPVVCSNDGQFGVVDRVEGDSIKLNKDDKGVHHYIPVSSIASVDDKVHANKPGEEMMRSWTTQAPGAKMA
ncbi:MAG: DUF2171 domain-containing protein [Sandaracinaceae bacterium]|nr:DUF2171 domain-containing protein [Sandaracinaceae bacterium]